MAFSWVQALATATSQNRTMPCESGPAAWPTVAERVMTAPGVTALEEAESVTAGAAWTWANAGVGAVKTAAEAVIARAGRRA